jgi:hypothetical protein
MGNQIEHNHVKMELFTEIEEDTLFFILPNLRQMNIYESKSMYHLLSCIAFLRE